MNVYYGTLHFIITAGLLIWVYLRRHQHYRQYRNLLGMTTALALIGYFAFPLAPPRMYPCHGCFVDTLDTIGGLWSYHSSAAKADRQPLRGHAEPALRLGAVVRHAVLVVRPASCGSVAQRASTRP